MFRMLKCFIALIVLPAATVQAEPDREWSYEPSPSNLEAREWFRDAKFGIFIHWGLYAELAGAGEMKVEAWVMQNKRIPIDKYERLADFFNPIAFDAEEWVLAFKSAGANYVTITSKHHEGFAMYDSAVSDYDIVDRTPFGRDVLAELKAACDKHGLKLFFYYSQLDWHHPDYYPRGHTGQGYTGRPDHGDWDRYIDYMNAQLEELLTNYGEISGVWFDGWWDQKGTSMEHRWRLRETYELIHRLQPQALIISNHHVEPLPGEDVQPFERDLPGENTSGYNPMDVSQLPLEMAQTMNGSWGYSLVDDEFKSADELVRTIVAAAGRDSNFLMNTGPMPDGRLVPENVETYKEIGRWMQAYGESIYGTRGGPISPRPWGVTTQKDNVVYVHILDWSDTELALPLVADVRQATLMTGGGAVRFEKTDAGYLVTLPADLGDGPVAIVRVELDQGPFTQRTE